MKRKVTTHVDAKELELEGLMPDWRLVAVIYHPAQSCYEAFWEKSGRARGRAKIESERAARLQWLRFNRHKITKARKDLGMTQRDLAEECGMSPLTISRLESGKTASHTGTIVRICEELGLEVPIF